MPDSYLFTEKSGRIMFFLPPVFFKSTALIYTRQRFQLIFPLQRFESSELWWYFCCQLSKQKIMMLSRAFAEISTKGLLDLFDQNDHDSNLPEKKLGLLKTKRPTARLCSQLAPGNLCHWQPTGCGSGGISHAWGKRTKTVQVNSETEDRKQSFGFRN